MNILFFDRCATAPGMNGIATVSVTLAECFEAQGSSVYYLGASRDLEDACVREKQFFLPNAKRSKLESAGNKKAFEQLIIEKQITHVIFQWGEGRKFPFPEICKRYGVYVFTVIHFSIDHNEQRLKGIYSLKTGFWGSFSRKFILPIKIFRVRRKTSKIHTFNLKNTDKMVLLSQSYFPTIKKFLPKNFDSSKLIAIPNPLKLLTCENVQKKKELLYVGRVDIAQKRLDLLLRVWEKLYKEFPEWTLRIVGGGKDLQKLKSLAGTLQLERVFFEGFQNPKKYYENAAIFCMTSAYEGFPMVLVEAAAHACVPVAFDSFSAVHDIIQNDKNGVFVPAFDCDKYAKELATLMSDNALRERLGSQAQKDVEKFSAPKIAEKWSSLCVDARKTQNILFLFDVPIVPTAGGVERVTAILSDMFKKSGKNVFILTRLKPKQTDLHGYLPDEKRWDSSVNIAFVKKFVREHEIGVVIWQPGWDSKFIYAKMLNRLGVKTCVCVHGGLSSKIEHVERKYGDTIFGLYKRWHTEKRLNALWRYNLENADKMILLCEREAAFLRNKFPAFSNKILAIPNPLPFDFSQKEKNLKKENILLVVARMGDGQKRISLLLDIWKELHEKFKDWSLCLVGDGSDRPALEKKVADLSLKRVSFEGFRPPEEYYKRASIFCMTSIKEGFGMTLIESGFYACARIAFDTFPALTDIIDDGKMGSLFKKVIKMRMLKNFHN